MVQEEKKDHLSQVPGALMKADMFPLLELQDLNSFSIASLASLTRVKEFKQKLNSASKAQYLKSLNEFSTQLSNLKHRRKMALIWSTVYGLIEAGLVTGLGITTKMVNQYAQQLGVLSDQWHDPFSNSTLNCEDKIMNFKTSPQLHIALHGVCKGAESCLNINSPEAKVCWLIAEAFKLVSSKVDGPLIGQILSGLGLFFFTAVGIGCFFKPYLHGERINFLTIKPFADLPPNEAKVLVKFWNEHGLGQSKVLLKKLDIGKVRSELQKFQERVNNL